MLFRSILFEVDTVPNDWPFYKFLHGSFELDETYKENINKEKQLKDIREQRQYECFSYINRGVLWYETLNEMQKVELKEWYQSWLDAPATLKIPNKPVWLI